MAGKDITQLSASEETTFQLWFSEVARKMGLNPNPDDPKHLYDYRAFFKSGQSIDSDPESGQLHFPSKFKSDAHPTRFRKTTDGQIFDTKNNHVVKGATAEDGLDIFRLGINPKQEFHLMSTPLDWVGPKYDSSAEKQTSGEAGQERPPEAPSSADHAQSERQKYPARNPAPAAGEQGGLFSPPEDKEEGWEQVYVKS